MALHLYNTLTRKKELFTPIDARNVRMYVCGPTVYDYAHIGNARPVIVFDVLFRLLRHLYGAEHVTYARNITDVDDKINARATEEYPNLPLNDAIREVTTRTTRQFHEDIAALGVLPPTVEPTCTAHVPHMVRMIEVLIAKGFAYAAEGHVLLDTTAVPDYGQLSGRSLDEMIAGARVEVAPYKRNPADSVLWKPSSDAQPGWDSPWGRGRPGWHIECSAMAKQHLGEVFDIHGGGIDLVFPHHENELAQSRSAHGTAKMANIWMHNGFLQVEGEKMSKSLGNFVTINELLAEWPGSILRYQMLKTHYRQPINWTKTATELAANELDEFRHFTRGVDPGDGKISSDVVDALSDDLNTPKAISALHGLLRRSKGVDFGDGPNDTSHYEAASSLLATLNFLGIDLANVEMQYILKKRRGNLDELEIERLIAARLAARKAKNFAEADRIRKELEAMGIMLMDSKNKDTGEIETTWEVKR